MEVVDTRSGNTVMTLQGAVEAAIRPDSYTCPGALEKTERTIENLAEMMGRLLEQLVARRVLNSEEVCDVLNPVYGRFEPYKER